MKQRMIDIHSFIFLLFLAKGGEHDSTTGWTYSTDVFIFDIATEQTALMSQGGLSVGRTQMGCGYVEHDNGERDVYFVGGKV